MWTVLFFTCRFGACGEFIVHGFFGPDGVFRPAFGIYGRDGEMAEKLDFCTMHIQPCAG